MTGTIPLGELVTIRGGGTPSRSVPGYWNGSIRWATVKDFKSTELAETEESITPEGLSDSATNVIPAGSVIVPTRMAVGKAAINTINLAINQDLKALLPNGEVDSRFLLHFMLAQGQFLESRAQGATVKGIKLDLLRSLPFPKIHRSEQRRIAAILDKADAIRGKRERSIALADDLLKSAFLKMFGNPLAMGRTGITLADIADISRGRFSPRPRNDPRYYGGDHPFIQTGEIASADGYLYEYRQTLNGLGTKVSKCFGAGTVFIALVGATIGATAIATRPFWCPDSVVGISPKTEEAPAELIEYLLRFWKQKFLDSAPETARGNINLETLRPIPVPKTNRGDANCFAKLYKTVHRMKVGLSMDRNDLLLALSQRAFGGEL